MMTGIDFLSFPRVPSLLIFITAPIIAFTLSDSHFIFSFCVCVCVTIQEYIFFNLIEVRVITLNKGHSPGGPCSGGVESHTTTPHGSSPSDGASHLV